MLLRKISITICLNKNNVYHDRVSLQPNPSRPLIGLHLTPAPITGLHHCVCLPVALPMHTLGPYYWYRPPLPCAHIATPYSHMNAHWQPSSLSYIFRRIQPLPLYKAWNAEHASSEPMQPQNCRPLTPIPVTGHHCCACTCSYPL